MPDVVYVKFDGAGWCLEGTGEPGVYPIFPRHKTWYLDRKRKDPKLAIQRKQLPLVPAFAITAHTSQGKTMPAAILDLNVDKRTDSRFGTVATSRVRSREDVLILRPFPLWLYQRGPEEGPDLLLRHLRGEDIDWATYRESQMPISACEKCRQVRAMDAFDYFNWEKIRSNRQGTCIACVHSDGGAKTKRKVTTGTSRAQCTSCKLNKMEAAFPRAQLNQPEAEERRECLACRRRVVQLTCTKCAEQKPVEAFADVMITVPANDVACRACQDKADGCVHGFFALPL